ncbi:DNA photolyase, FAD-binding/Cryptochrome [Mycena floridula]|nr:DNA photolyase, FAD-binding/Cryptochrome [Mycena floridula]
MAKRTRISDSMPNNKRIRTEASGLFLPNKVATQAHAQAVDAAPPLKILLKIVKDETPKLDPKVGHSIVYWMRMGDLRLSDNRALSVASKEATRLGLPLIVLFVLSPQDFVAHDRGSRRIDFTLRNLVILKKSLAALNIPLYTVVHEIRRTLPSRVLSVLEQDLSCRSLYANYEYEIDEVRRDIKLCTLAKPKGIQITLTHDKCIVEPGVVLTKEQKPYSVYSPYQRNWITVLNGNLPHYLEECPSPKPNDESIRTSNYAKYFDSPVPESLRGFQLDESDLDTMTRVWPGGEAAAAEILRRFLTTSSRSSQLGVVDPLADGAEQSTKKSRIASYDDRRDQADLDTTSRLSPYLSAGVISARACVRATMDLLKVSKVEAGKTTGIGRWVQELAWRDFYTNVLVSFPRVSMGRPFLEKYADVVWEAHSDESGDNLLLKKWKEGKTGFPIVDAGMRCLNEFGWMHNRLRMICASFLIKDFGVSWAVGERYFMEQLIDGDLASNNGGWQWCASTGADPCPYFRIFNPYSQSTKADPSGNFIRQFVPELKKLKGTDLHSPSAETARAVGYCQPIVQHNVSRARCLARYKNPGTE